MSDLSPAAPDFEAQASAFLRLLAEPRHLASLRGFAVKLAGGDHERGHDLYTDVLLDVHAYVQRRGWPGPPVDLLFYFVRALRNKASKPVPLVLPQPAEEVADVVADEPDPERAHLAEQVFAEARAWFAVRDRVLLQLYVDGLSWRDIAKAVGSNTTVVQERLRPLLTHLRAEFGQAFAALRE